MLLKRFLPLGAFLILVLLLVRGLALDPTELLLLGSVKTFHRLICLFLIPPICAVQRLAGQTRIDQCLGYMVFFLSVDILICSNWQSRDYHLRANYKDEPAKASQWLVDLEILLGDRR